MHLYLSGGIALPAALNAAFAPVTYAKKDVTHKTRPREGKSNGGK